MNNKELRQALRKSKVAQWQLARKIEINESSLSRQLRDELDEKTKQEYLQYIDEIIKEREQNE